MLLVCLGGLMLAGCAQTTPAAKKKSYFSSKEYGVAASPRVVQYGQPVPRGGGREMVGQPYVVRGRLYRPAADEDYSKTGTASWYGEDFHGRLTANGEVYDMDSLSAAHPTLPLPSYARVTNVDNGRSVIVRVNDRGPYVGDRVIDLSSKAADLLDFKEAGKARVRVEYVGKARLDGNDQSYLMASYRGPGRTMFADNQATSRSAAASPVVTAAAAMPARKVTDVDQVIYGSGVATGFTGNLRRGDPISGIISNNSLRSYAELKAPSPGHLAIDGLLHPKAETAPAAAAASPAVIQAGAFGDVRNAERLASRLSGFGEVKLAEVVISGRRLTSVRVVIDERKVAADAVIKAAAEAGVSGARRLAE